MTFGNLGRTVNLGNTRSSLKRGIICAKAHRATKITRFRTLFEHIALEPLSHQTDNRFLGRTELGR
ncbi:hypothetical protein D3C79_1019140 [compost metagenome]